MIAKTYTQLSSKHRRDPRKIDQLTTLSDYFAKLKWPHLIGTWRRADGAP